MEVVKNRVSKKYFIVLEDSQETDFLVITPDGKIRQLEKHLFTQGDTIDPGTSVWKRRLTRVQMSQYREYHDE
ncbi:MAG: hypothetical protein AB7S77_02720 [Desulfatirhabdiaceae bacterium]